MFDYIAILNQKFTGKKTYITAIIAVLTAALTYLTGESTLMAALNLAFTGVIGATIRNAVPTVVVPAVTETK